MSETYLSVKEFAERFRYKTGRVYRLLKRGEVAYIDVKPYRIPESEVHDFVARKLRPAEPTTPPPTARPAPARPVKDYSLKILKRP